MSNIINTTIKLHHRSVLPPNVDKASCLAKFADHEFLLRLDEDLVSLEELPPPADSVDGKTKRYKVTDSLKQLPKGVPMRNISYTNDITQLDNGIRWFIKTPLGVTQTSTWTIEPAKAEDNTEGRPDALVLVEDVEIKGNRMFAGTVKSKCEENKIRVHGAIGKHITGVQYECSVQG